MSNVVDIAPVQMLGKRLMSIELQDGMPHRLIWSDSGQRVPDEVVAKTMERVHYMAKITQIVQASLEKPEDLVNLVLLEAIQNGHSSIR